MSVYYENRIVLTRPEALTFKQKMDDPSDEVSLRRDQTLSWNQAHLVIQPTATGFTVVVNE